MRAISYSQFGGPEVLTLVDVPVPAPAGAQVRVAVRAAGVNPIDWKIRSGTMSRTATFPTIPGLEIAGVVDAVGPDAAGFAVGDEVFGWSDSGGYAEYALATAVAAKPATLDWSQAVEHPGVRRNCLAWSQPSGPEIR